MQTCLYYDQVKWLPLCSAIRSFRELHSHTVCLLTDAMHLQIVTEDDVATTNLNSSFLCNQLHHLMMIREQISCTCLTLFHSIILQSNHWSNNLQPSLNLPLNHLE